MDYDLYLMHKLHYINHKTKNVGVSLTSFKHNLIMFWPFNAFIETSLSLQYSALFLHQIQAQT